MRARAALLALGLCVLAGAAARAERLVADLSQDRISISTDFDGSEILVFGAVARDAPAPPGDGLAVVVTVSGPREDVTVRRKSRVGGIWINTASATVLSAPSFYAVASSVPLAAALDPAEDERWRVTTPRAMTAPDAAPMTAEEEAFLNALIRIRTAAGTYGTSEADVSLRDGTLFSAEIRLPADLTEGDYAARILLTRDGRVIDSHATSIFVRKVGLERWLYLRAHRDPLLYGLLSLAIAAAAGWGASALFRVIRGA